MAVISKNGLFYLIRAVARFLHLIEVLVRSFKFGLQFLHRFRFMAKFI